MRMKKIGLLLLALVLVLGVTGAAFASWSDTLYINATVTTDNVDVEFTDACTSNDLPPTGFDGAYIPGLGTLDPGLSGNHWTGNYVTQNRNVAATDVTRSNTRAADNEAETSRYDDLTITMTDVYPSYAPMVSIYIHNDGTVPVKITSWDFGTPPTWLSLLGWEITLDNAHVDGSLNGASGYTGTFPASNINGFPIKVDEVGEGANCVPGLIAALQNEVIDPGQTLDIHLIYHVDEEGSYDGAEDAPQGATVSFTSTATFTQWNI